MKKLWKKFRKHWWGLLIVVGAIASAMTALMMRRTPPAPEKLIKELLAIDAAQQVAELAAEQGHAVAVKKLELDHEKTLAALDEKQAAKAAKMKQDPEALARWLVRMGKL